MFESAKGVNIMLFNGIPHKGREETVKGGQLSI